MKRFFIMALIIIFGTCTQLWATTPEKEPEPDESVPAFGFLTSEATLSVVGDLMVHEWQLTNAYNKKTKAYDFNYTFAEVKKYLEAADYTIGNLETTFAGAARGYATYPTFNTPDEFSTALKWAGFDFLTTANNHCNDTREAGILRTLDILDELDIDHAGTYRTAEERERVFVKNINGIKLAFLSYTYGTNGIPVAKPHTVALLDEAAVKRDIELARAASPDFVVVLSHMGTEYATAPSKQVKDWTRKMLEWGADVLLFSHPHVLQPMEMITVTDKDGSERECFVIYSLGNFISSQRTKPRDAGIILNIRFEKGFLGKARIAEVSYIPTWVMFVNKRGVYEIKALSVYDCLTAPDGGANIGLRASDVARLKDVHNEIAAVYQGKRIALDEIQNEYVIFGDQR